jgi:hypothetical protein
MGQYDFNFLKEMKEYFSIIIILSIIFSYFLGLIVHRLIYIITSILKKGGTDPDDVVLMYQNIENHLFEYLNHQYRHIVITRLLIPGFLFLGFVLFFWFRKSPYSVLSWYILILFIILGILSYIITKVQKKDYKNLLNSTLRSLKKDDLSSN